MAEMGYGAPSWTPEVSEKDWGYGDEYTAGSRDTGYGSPHDEQAIHIFLESNQVKLPDDGGVVINIFGEWGDLSPFTQRVGPFDVRYKDKSGGLHRAPGGWAGHPYECYTDIRQRYIEAHVPVLAQGVYDIVIKWNNHSRTLINAIEIVPHNLSTEVHSIRTATPQFYAVGKRSMPLEDGNTEFTVLSALTRTTGQVIQRIFGHPETVTTAEFIPPATTIDVRSTLGFPSSGTIYINGEPVDYTGTTPTSFTGVTNHRRYQQHNVGGHICSLPKIK